MEGIEFSLSEGKYSYLEWSPLHRAYSESKKEVSFCE